MSYKIIARIEVGSHLYGTALPTSDRDIKEIIIPDAKSILLQKADHIVRPEGDDDIERIPLHRYMLHLIQGQTSALDQLFAPEKHIIDTTPLWNTIKSYKDRFIHKKATAFMGYCRSQANKYCSKAGQILALDNLIEFLNTISDKNQKLLGSGIVTHLSVMKNLYADIASLQSVLSKTSEASFISLKICEKLIPTTVTISYAISVLSNLRRKYGKRTEIASTTNSMDWKAMMHAVRVAEEAEELLSTGKITFPRPNADFLRKIKLGEIARDIVVKTIDDTIKRVEDLEKISTIREEPDIELANKLIIDTYKNAIGEM